MAITWKSEYFYGNKISDYGIENGRVDYRTLSKAFDCVLNNNIIDITGWENWSQVSGGIDNSEEIEELNEKIQELEDQIYDLEVERDEQTDDDRYDELDNKILDLRSEVTELEDQIADLEEEQERQPDIFQYYIVSDNALTILEEADEIVWYNSELDMYVWGITHYGTAWDYVLTNIRIEKED